MKDGAHELCLTTKFYQKKKKTKLAIFVQIAPYFNHK